MLARNRIILYIEEQPNLKIQIFNLACLMNISGWIINIEKSTLEIIAQADEKELDKFKLKIKGMLEDKKMETILCEPIVMNRSNFLIG